MTNITHTDAYPGYEWVAEIGGDDYLETLSLLEQVMKEEKIDAYCPGTKSTVAGLLASHRDAARAREIIESDPRLKGRWLAMLDARGSHRIT
jgi:hypothetical protein